MIPGVRLFILCTVIVFGTIALFGFEFCFKEKVIFVIGIETFLALLIIGAYILIG